MDKLFIKKYFSIKFFLKFLSRYSYLPYWYTLFYETEQTGVPPMRPLFYEFPEDENSFALDNEYMLGPGLLVHPIVKPNVQHETVYLPGKDQYW